ncbi:MAG TPA: hypothetical protein VEM57_07280 [Candidatus Binatus sp.]|nr:hypothetical protein [Candidatus Binatus sp.]
MRHAVNGSILGMLLLAAAPAAAQSMVELGAAMGVHGALNGAGASSGGSVAMKARETIQSHAASGTGGWVDAGDGRGSTGGTPGKAWATAGSGPTSGAGKGWATASSGPRAASTGGWSSQSSGGGKNAWVSRNQPGGATGRR